MPELPEVETVCRGLAPHIHQQRIEGVLLRRAGVRTPFTLGLEDACTGQRITHITRRAKYLQCWLENDAHLLIHLGMSGQLRVREAGVTPHKHDHVIITLEDERELVFNDPRRFGIVEYYPPNTTPHWLAHLGVEPFDAAFTAEYLAAQLSKRKAPVKPVLMDQKLVVGVGNIYASEALHLARISPLLSACEAGQYASALVESIRHVLEAAIASGGSTLRNYATAEGKAGYFQHQFQVYERADQPCACCATPITRIVQAGRATYYCESCQRYD